MFFVTSLVAPVLLLSTLVATGAQTISTDLSYNFTVAAVNLTLPNANSTGVPLVLGQNGATAGLTFEVTSTYASFPYNEYPALGLVDGSLRAFLSSGEWVTNATSLLSGGTLGWVSSRYYSSPSAQGYTAVQNPGDEFPVLAAYGITSLWSLCPFDGFRGQTNVVFNVTADIPPPPYLGFDPSDCYNVKLNIVPVPV